MLLIDQHVHGADNLVDEHIVLVTTEGGSFGDGLISIPKRRHTTMTVNTVTVDGKGRAVLTIMAVDTLTREDMLTLVADGELTKPYCCGKRSRTFRLLGDVEAETLIKEEEIILLERKRA